MVAMTELARLHARIAYLEAEIARRDKEADDIVGNLVSRTTLSITQARIFKALATGQTLSRDRLLALCCRQGVNHRSVDKQIGQLRQLGPVRVMTRRGIGYCFHPDDIERARQLLTGEV
jgi:DNA-binding response OmpR family regulator